MATDGHKRALRKWVSFIIQTTLKHRPTYTPCDAKKYFKAQFEVTLHYHKLWWEKELAQNKLYKLARSEINFHLYILLVHIQLFFIYF